MFTRLNANIVSYLRLHACLHAGLIKLQNTFAHKIFQHSNALCVQKLQDVRTIPAFYVRKI